MAAAVLLAALALAASCSGHDPGGREGDPAEGDSAAGDLAPKAADPAPAAPSFDLGQVMDRIHFSFRPDAADPGAWTGGHTTYAVRADAGGFQVTPVTHEAAGPRSGAAGTFATVSIGRAGGAGVRGPIVRPLLPEAVGVAEDGHLVLERPEAAEHLRNNSAGVEQSFDFDAAPAGGGDLVVRVQVDGLEYAGATDGGHHFIDPESGLGLRYGVATWLDARGAATPVPVAWTADGELALQVPEALVEGSAYPAVLDPVISPEFGMDQPVTGPSLGSQTDPAVAFDGTNFFVVWADKRSDPAYDFYAGDVYGTRIAPDGTVLDPRGVPVSAGFGLRDQPVVAWDGTNFVVAWRDDRVVNSARAYAARVTPAGSVLDPAGISLDPTIQSTTSPSIAWNGTQHLVVWRGSPIVGGPLSLRGAFLTPAGSVTVAPAFSGVNGSTPAVASAGGAHMLAWNSSGNIRLSRVSAAGGVLDPAGILLGAGTCPRIATDGTQYAIVWLDASYIVRATRVDASANLLDASPMNIGTSSSSACPAIAFDGTNYEIGWPTAAQQMSVRRLPTTGAPIVGTTTAGPSYTYAHPAIGAGSGTILVTWARAGTVAGASQDVVTLSRLTPAGVLLAPSDVPIVSGSNRQVAPDAAFDGTNYLVVWEDTRTDGDRDVYGTRVSPAGAILDPSGIAIADATADQAAPRVAFDGTSYVVVWQDTRNAATTGTDIFATRVMPDGTALAANALCTAAASQTTPDIASGGGTTLAAWSDARNGGSSIYAARVVNGLSIDGNGFGVTGQSGSRPAIDYGQGQFLVAWMNSTRIYASRVAPDGVVQDAVPLQLASATYTMVDGPSAVFDGTNHIVVWRHQIATRQIRGRKVPTSGAAPADFIIQDPAADNGGVAITFDGVTPVVAWAHPTLQSSTIFAARLFPSGAVAPPGVLNVELGYGPAISPSLTTSGAGQSLITYAHFDAAVGLGSYRARGRFISLDQLGAACSGAIDCASGFCADGVCCNAACSGGAGDCQACSIAAGAPANGTCAPLTGTACTDGDACTQADTCQAGVCTGGNAVVCPTPDSCHVGVCNPASGACSVQQKADGSPCDDGTACTQTDTCQNGMCSGGAPVICPAPTVCHASTCDPTSGACMAPPLADGTACSDGSACTQTDACQAGACVGGNPVACAPPAVCHDVGICDPASGQCAYAPNADGSPCDDGNACTQVDACQSGACTGGSPVACAPPDACHNAGVCNPASGQCAYAPKANGTACDDNNGCTQTDTCQAGACTGSNPLVCSPSDDCHTAACDPASGQCAETEEPDGTACDDGDACTENDTCETGACAAGTPVTCNAIDACHDVGTCDPATGTCSNPEKADGAPCPGGTCVGGACENGAGGAGGAGGGTTSTSAGGSPGTGTGTGGSGSGEDGGCGCRTANDPPASRGAPLALLALALVARRRRRGDA